MKVREQIVVTQVAGDSINSMHKTNNR